ncbi:hypothetical protein EDC24_2280 [Aquisalibacillus elongatus]|uniref:Uncharacterized protein n=1 Tax=Aquisalibacillus elongatus TaxID=485577 RepID=A0A3N5B3Q6_9BACI|nr:hypothetical protein EDC24_2280 [Aquisalibacillus elongatus]
MLQYVFHTTLCLILVFCAYLILKPLLIKLVKQKCVMTLNYLAASLITSLIILTGLILTQDNNSLAYQPLEIIGALWISIVIIGCILIITLIVKRTKQYFRTRS